MKLDDPMSMKRLGGRTPRMRVSLSPSKIPYVGFSPVRLQTSSRARPSSKDLYALPASACESCGPYGQVGGFTRPSTLVQRPLARRRVLLSRRVIAYYGLIRASRALLPTYEFVDRSLLPPAARGSPLYSACLYPSCHPWTPADRTSARSCHFIVRVGLHRLRSGSASALSARSGICAACNEAD